MISTEIFGSLIRTAPDIKLISYKRSNTIHLPQLFSSHKTIHHWELESLWNSSQNASFGKLSLLFAKESITVLKVCDVLCQAHLYEADVKISRNPVEVFQSLAPINQATSNANSSSHSESPELHCRPVCFTVNITICNVNVRRYIVYGCIYLYIYIYIVGVLTHTKIKCCNFLFVCCIFASFPTGELKRPSNWKKHAFRLSRITWRTSALRKTGPVFVKIWCYATSWQHGYGWLQPIVYCKEGILSTQEGGHLERFVGTKNFVFFLAPLSPSWLRSYSFGIISVFVVICSLKDLESALNPPEGLNHASLRISSFETQTTGSGRHFLLWTAWQGLATGSAFFSPVWARSGTEK